MEFLRERKRGFISFAIITTLVIAVITISSPIGITWGSVIFACGIGIVMGIVAENNKEKQNEV